METNVCQSCGMPLQKEEELGTTTNGNKTPEYCMYCYQNGAFTKDTTMEEMIDHCLEYLDEFNKDSKQQFTREEARKQMLQFFPTLKRWKK